jgi:hypothetical protein
MGNRQEAIFPILPILPRPTDGHNWSKTDLLVLLLHHIDYKSAVEEC